MKIVSRKNKTEEQFHIRDGDLHNMFIQVAPRIKAMMMEKGSVLIGYQPLGAKVNFFRCVFSNPATQHVDIDFLLDEITRLGEDLHDI